MELLDDERAYIKIIKEAERRCIMMNYIEKIIDEIIAFLVVVATIMFIAWGANVPDWWATSFGMVIAFYFSRKAVKDGREGEQK